MIKEDRDDLRNKISAVIDEANLVPETKTALTELVNTFIAELARQCKKKPSVDVNTVKSRAYTLWSYLINEGAFNQTVWWIEDENFAWSVTLYTDEKNPNILSDLHDTLIMEPVDALGYLRGDTDEPDIGEYTPICSSTSALHDKLIETINIIASGCVTCQAGPWPFDPDLPDNHNGCIYIVTDADGEAVRYNVDNDSDNQLHRDLKAIAYNLDLNPETKTELLGLIDEFIAELNKQREDHPESINIEQAMSDAYALWRQLINDGAFNQTVWWIINSNLAGAMTIYADTETGRLTDIHMNTRLTAIQAHRYLNGDTEEPEGSFMFKLQDSLSPHSLVSKAIKHLAAATRCNHWGFLPLDPSLTPNQNGAQYIVDHKDGTCDYATKKVNNQPVDTAVEDPNLCYIDDIGAIPVAIVHPNINGWNPSIANMSTAPFVQFVNMLCVKRLNDSPTPNKCHPWVPMSDIMLIEGDHGSLELGSCSDTTQTLVHPMGLPRVDCATEQRSAMYNLVSNLKNFKLKAEKFATCWDQLCDFARHSPSHALHVEKNRAESTITLIIEDATGYQLELKLHVTHVGHMTLPIMYETLDVPELLDKWNPDEPPYPNREQRMTSLGTWCNINVDSHDENDTATLLQSAFDYITLKYTKVQNMEQLILGLNLVDEPKQVCFQVPTSCCTTLDLMFNLIRESHELNEAAVIFIQSLKVLDI